MLHFYCDTVIKLIVQLQKKQYQAQGRLMEIPRGFRGGGEKKSKNLKKKSWNFQSVEEGVQPKNLP